MINRIKNKFSNAISGIDNSYNDFKDVYDKLFIDTDIEGIGGLQFDIRKEESLKLEASITDYVLENNVNIQSNITINPIELTFTGLFGENVIEKPKITKFSQFIQDKLNPLAMFNNDLVQQAQEYIRKANEMVDKVNNIVDKVGGGIDYLKNLTSQTENKQEKACQILMMMWRTRQIVSIRSDFCKLDNMAISRINFSQGNETTGYSQATITLKQLTFANIKKKKKSANKREKQLQNVNKGKTQGKKSILVKGGQWLQN